jgi:hypothetical protein
MISSKLMKYEIRGSPLKIRADRLGLTRMAVNIQLIEHQFKVETPLQPPPVLAPSSHVPAVACTSKQL